MEYTCLKHGAIVGARCRCGVCVDEQIARLEHELAEARAECERDKRDHGYEVRWHEQTRAKLTAAERTLEAVREWAERVLATNHYSQLCELRELLTTDAPPAPEWTSEPPTEFVDALSEALQLSWNDYTLDTGCFPSNFKWRGGNGKLCADFRGGNFIRLAAAMLWRKLSEWHPRPITPPEDKS